MNYGPETWVSGAWQEEIPEMAGIERALSGSDPDRLALARMWAEQEYHHPESEAARARAEQRSFCLCHEKVTARSFLLIHGWTACPFEMRELGQNLYQKGYNVVGPRLAGHGASIADFGRSDGRHWFRSVRKGLGMAALLGREVVVVGESMGGAIAVLLAKAYPRLVGRLVLCAPCFEIANPLAGLARYRWFRFIVPRHDMGPQSDWMKGYWYQIIPTKGIGELVKVADQARRAGPSVTVPIAIIQAENDALVKPSGAGRFLETVTGVDPSRKKLILLKDGHHNLTVDLNPRKQEVFEMIYEICGV